MPCLSTKSGTKGCAVRISVRDLPCFGIRYAGASRLSGIPADAVGQIGKRIDLNEKKKFVRASDFLQILSAHEQILTIIF